MTSELLMHIWKNCGVIPSHVNVLALTATATLATLRAVEQNLNLQKPEIVSLPPDRPNIYFSIAKQRSMETFVEELASGLQVQRLQFPKTVIFCRRYTGCVEIYMHLQFKIGKDFTEPHPIPIYNSLG